MLYNDLIAKQMAKYLLDIQAVKLNVKEPFTWASGIKSPIYCDNRKILSYPDIRTYVCNSMTEIIKAKYPEAEIIAGVATGAIAIGMLAAQALNLPYIYIRSSQKDHGLQNKIEGILEKNKKVVVIEDLVSTGKSSLDAVHAVREAGARVLGMVAIYTYGLPASVDNFNNAQCNLTTLTNYDTTITAALDIEYIKGDELETLKDWKKNPSEWHNK